MADRFPEGQLYLNLRGFAAAAPLRPIDALAALLRSLGTPPEQIPTSEVEAAGRYRSLLAGRQVLLVLDNAASVEQVRPLLPGTAGCLVLVTSRDRLAGLVARDGAHRITLDVLTPGDARLLLTRLLGADRTNAESDSTATLAQACAYLPIALRIAAANLAERPRQTIAGYLTELTTDDRLSHLQVYGDPEAALRATFDLSYQRLTTEAQRMFRLLGLVPGPDFTPDAAAALAGIPASSAAELMSGLAGGHLIEETAPGRFAFHDLLRRYARERVQSEDGEAAGQEALFRLLRWFLHCADSAARLIHPQLLRLPLPREVVPEGVTPDYRSNTALAWMESERRNMVAAVRHSADRGPRRYAWMMADRLRGFFWSRRDMVDWLTTTSAALAAAESENDLQAQAAMRMSIGNADHAAGHYPDAIGHYTAAADLADKVGWLDGKGSALANLGIAHELAGDSKPALECFAQALALYEITGRLGGQAMLQGNLGHLYHRMGDLRLAAEHLAREVATYRELGREADVAFAYAVHNLGSVEHDLGRLAQSVEKYRLAARLFRRVGNRHGEAHALDSLSVHHLTAGRYTDAYELAQAAVRLAGETGDARAEGTALNTLGSVHCRTGRPHAAVACHERVIAVARRMGDPKLEIESLLGLATARCRLEQHDSASSLGLQALEHARKNGYKLHHGLAMTVLAEIRLAQGQRLEAGEYARQAIDNHRKTGHRLGEARALVAAGSAFGIGDGATRPHWRAACRIFIEIGAPVPREVPVE